MSDTRKPVAKTTNAKPSIQEPVILGWALAVDTVALANMETAVVAASPGSKLASWALWGFGCWAMAGLAVALVDFCGGCAAFLDAFLDAWILSAAEDAVDAAAAWRGARSRACETHRRA